MIARTIALRALAGLETGILGGLLTLVWYALSSTWNHHKYWMTANYFAMLFYGDAALRMGLSRATLSGVALHLCVAGLLGLLFGLMLPVSGPHARVTLIGLMLAFSLYLVLYGPAWRRWNPATMLLGHVLFGVWLGRYPLYYRQLESPE